MVITLKISVRDVYVETPVEYSYMRLQSKGRICSEQNAVVVYVDVASGGGLKDELETDFTSNLRSSFAISLTDSLCDSLLKQVK